MRKNKAPLSLAEQHNEACAEIAASLSVFDTIAADLDAAAEKTKVIEERALRRAEELRLLADLSRAETARAAAAAVKIRALLG